MNDEAAGRRGLLVAALACAASAGVTLLGTGRVWLSYVDRNRGLAALPKHATGHVAAPAAAALALVVLAGVVAFPATRGAGRRVAGAAVALAAFGIAYQCSAAVLFGVERLPGHGSGDFTGGRLTAWPWVVLIAAVVGAGAGLLAVLGSGRWPAMGRRYTSAASARPGGGSPAAGRGTDEPSMWDRLDRGEDPTV